MENKKIPLQACSKCESCGVTEIKRQWEEDELSTDTPLVGYYECENCHFTWTIILARRKAKATPI